MRDLTEGSEIKQIMRFATPMFLGYLFQQAYQFGDTYVLGRLLGKEEMSASGAVFPILFFIMSGIIGFTSAGTILTAQFFGSKKYVKIKSLFYTMLIVSIIGGCVITVLGISTQGFLFRLMGIEKEIFDLAVKYFTVLMYGSVAIFLYNSITAVFRGFGDSNTPLILSIISNVINLFLDFLFVKYLNKGIEFVAWATVIAYVIASFLGFILILKSLNAKIFKGNRFKIFDFNLVKELIKIGLPNSFQMSFVAIAFFFIFTFVAAFGTDVLAAFSATGRINSMVLSVAFVLSTALTAFAGQNFGAKKCERIKRGMYKTIFIASILGIFISATIYLFPDKWIKIFTTDENVINIGAGYLKIVSPFYVIFYVVYILMGVMKGLGETMTPMRITWIMNFFVRVPVSFFKSFDIQLFPIKIVPENFYGIWYGEPYAWILGLIITLFIFHKKFCPILNNALCQTPKVIKLWKLKI